MNDSPQEDRGGHHPFVGGSAITQPQWPFAFVWIKAPRLLLVMVLGGGRRRACRAII
jgi:hypothetical protein